MNPEENTNFYNPDDDDDAGPAAAGADKDTTVTWTASEYIEHQRGVSWYTLLALATLGLAAAVYFLTKDYFATGTIVALGVIVGAFVGRKPRQVQFELSESGLRIGEKSYSYNLFKSFAVVREGNLISLNLTPIKRFMPPVSAYFDPKDEQKITNIIGEHLPYEERKPGAIDRLSLRLKL
jgi:hypothetical protein